MWQLANTLEDTDYRVARVGYRSLQDTPEQILEDLEKQIDACCIGRSQKLHFVGHSLGGLLIRAYLMNHDIANLGRVVLIGTPNTGMEIVDNLRHEWWFVVLGPTAQVLGTDGDSFPKSIGPPDYPVGVIAGISTIMPNEDLLRGDDDGLVSVESTKIEGMEDFVVVERRHSALRYDKDVAHYVVSFLKTGRFNKSGE
jgi:pimeloyl-ACP methyl ester carboxylesterase